MGHDYVTTGVITPMSSKLFLAGQLLGSLRFVGQDYILLAGLQPAFLDLSSLLVSGYLPCRNTVRRMSGQNSFTTFDAVLRPSPMVPRSRASPALFECAGNQEFAKKLAP
jgi:hypothetical protein